MRSLVNDTELERRLRAEGYRPSGETFVEVTDVTLSEIAFALGVPEGATGLLVGLDEGDDGLGFVHKKIGKMFKKVGRWIKKQGRKINWKKVLKIGIPIIAGATLLAFAGVPILALTKMVGAKGAGLIKSGAVYTQRIVLRSGRGVVALLTKKQRDRLVRVGVRSAVALSLAKYQQAAARAGIPNATAQIVDDWNVIGNELQFKPPGVLPSELKADPGFLGGTNLMPLLLIGGGGVLLLFATRGKK